MKLSVVVPVLNEAQVLERCLIACKAVADELIVVDGGSRDRTVDIARQNRAVVLEHSGGRGPQLNAGAASATGDVLLFVHADSVVDGRARAAIEQAVGSGAVGGNFKLRFVPSAWAARVYSAANHWRRLALRRYYGDSGIFVRRDAFQELGGFAAIPILEDYEFVCRLERLGRTHYEQDVTIEVSSRRFASSPLRTLGIWAGLQGLYSAGIPPQKLASLYRHVR